MLLSTKPQGFSLEGEHVARAIGYVLYGTIFIPGSERPQLQCRITWELCNDLRNFGREFVLSPKQISRDYAASLYGKSHLKRHLISWMGPEVETIMIQGFDPKIILGKACRLQIQHGINENTGAHFEQVADIRPFDEAHCPPQFNPTKYLTFDEFDEDLFRSLPAFVQNKISRSKEYPTRKSVRNDRPTEKSNPF